ncbi:hypothetical protein B0H13DRAFT_2516127 [Mycena leptocephala]|nr:hypothetical protein B0H13DRAFT_2516127 [Mycena leptocephala]
MRNKTVILVQSSVYIELAKKETSCHRKMWNTPQSLRTNVSSNKLCDISTVLKPTKKRAWTKDRPEIHRMGFNCSRIRSSYTLPCKPEQKREKNSQLPPELPAACSNINATRVAGQKLGNCKIGVVLALLRFFTPTLAVADGGIQGARRWLGARRAGQLLPRKVLDIFRLSLPVGAKVSSRKTGKFSAGESADRLEEKFGVKDRMKAAFVGITAVNHDAGISYTLPRTTTARFRLTGKQLYLGNTTVLRIRTTKKNPSQPIYFQGGTSSCIFETRLVDQDGLKPQRVDNTASGMLNLAGELSTKV